MKPTIENPVRPTCDPVIDGWDRYGANMCRLVEDMPRAGRAVEVNERIHELVFADRALTPEEWAELAAYERGSE